MKDDKNELAYPLDDSRHSIFGGGMAQTAKNTVSAVVPLCENPMRWRQADMPENEFVSTTNYELRSTHLSRGITFIEVLVSITVFVFAILAIVSSVLFFYRTNTYAIQQASAVSSAQRAIEETVKTIREASYASNGAYPIVSINVHDFTFYADIDADPYIERIRYHVQGTSLLRDVTDPSGDPPVYGPAQTTSVISETVRNIEQGVATFQYYNLSGQEITNFAQIAEVRLVTMNVIVNVDPNRLPNQLTLRSNAALRNLK